MTLPCAVELDLARHLKQEEEQEARDQQLKTRAQEIEASLLLTPVGFDELMEHIADDMAAVAHFNALCVRTMRVTATFEAYQTVQKLQRFFREHAETLAMREARVELDTEEFFDGDDR